MLAIVRKCCKPGKAGAEKESSQSASQQLIELQGNAVAEALAGGRPAAEAEVKAALGRSLLQGGAYHSSRAKRFLDLARASYNRAATYNGRSWQHIDVSEAESAFNLRVIGKTLGNSERIIIDPPLPNDIAAVEVCFRGSVFVGEEGGFNLDNWCRVNLNPELTPIDGQIGEASQLKGVHVHAGFQSGYLAARGPVLTWLNEQREHPDQRLHISCCGHSLGAALATMLAFDLGFMGRDSVELVTWASPRVGDKAFCDTFAKHVPDVARFTCGADLVPRLPAEKLGFEHVCPEMRLDAWVTSAKSVVTGDFLSSHDIAMHAINLENCFRDPLAVVRTREGGWRLTATYASIAFAAVHVGTGVDIVQTVAGWLSANDKVLKRLDGAVDQLQLQLKTLQESVDSISGFLLHSLEEQDVTLTIRELRSEKNALMRSAALPGEVVNFERLRVAQHKLLDLGPAIWGARDARSKHGPKMVDLLITSYSVEIGLLRNHKPGQVQARRGQIDQEVRSTFPAIEAAMRSGSFFREQCPALDCLLPQLLVGPPLRIPSDDGGVVPVVPLARDGADGQRQKAHRASVGGIAAADLADHVLSAIKGGRADLLTPHVIGDLEHGIDTQLQSDSVRFMFSSCQFLHAKVALTMGFLGVLNLGVPIMGAVVVGKAIGNSLADRLGAYDDHDASTTEEEIAFVQRYGFASKYLLKSTIEDLGPTHTLAWGFWDLKEGDSLFEFVLKSKSTTNQMKIELLHVLIRACGSEMIGAQRLERALERSAEAMGRMQSDKVFAAPAHVLSGVKGFQRSS